MKHPDGNLVGYRARKAAQVAFAFLRHTGGRMDKLKLIKLLYLAERQSVETRGRPMFYDEYYSLKDGPICSAALNGINNRIDNEVWGQYIKKWGDRDIFLLNEISDDDLDELSKSDLSVIDTVASQFAGMETRDVRHWTHEWCAEYEEVPAGRRSPIDIFSMARAVGSDDPEGVASHVREYRSIASALEGDNNTLEQDADDALGDP